MPPQLVAPLLLLLLLPLETGSSQQPQQQQQTRQPQTPPQDRLHRSLLHSYDRNTRPVMRASDQIGVTFSVQLNRLMDLDEKNQILHLNVVVTESWRDQRLVWEPAIFGGLLATVLPSGEIWLPDVYVYNNAADGNDGFIHDNYSRVTVDYTGRVLWNIPTTVRSSCSVDVLYFPFDHQFCEVLFASWTYDASQLTLSQPPGQTGVDGAQMQEHQELKVTGFRMALQRRSMLNNLTYPVLALKLHIERKALYYSYTVIAPSIMLCVLTMFSFWLPCHIAEKIEIGLNVFLFLYFLELLIAENTPESNSTPLIGIFLTMVMTLNSLSLIMATVVMHVHSRGDHDPCPRVPAWLWLLGNRVLGPLTFSSRSSQLRQQPPPPPSSLSSSSSSSAEAAAAAVMELPAQEKPDEGGVGKGGARTRDDQSADTDEDDDDDDGDNGNNEDGGASRPRDSGRNRFEQLKWTFVAEVIDKFLFEFYLLSTVLSVLIVLHIMPEVNSRSVQFDRF